MQEEKFVDVDGIRTRYFEAGNGEHLLLLHGGNFGDNDNVDCALNWALNWEGFARAFHVIALDRDGPTTRRQGTTPSKPALPMQGDSSRRSASSG